jgi:hypothetical protein
MARVLLPYVKGVDAMTGQRAVSFDVPEEAWRVARCSIHCISDESAAEPASLLASRS